MALGIKFQTMGPLYLTLFLPRLQLYRTCEKSLIRLKLKLLSVLRVSNRAVSWSGKLLWKT